MAGINASSSTTVFTNTGIDASTSGFLSGEIIALTDSISGTDYLWALSVPSGSNALRVGFAGETDATAYFTPDVSGVYTVTLVVDGVTHVLRIAAANIALSNTLEGIRLQPVTDAQIPTPPAGATFYWSSTQGALSMKDSAGDVFTVDVTAVP